MSYMIDGPHEVARHEGMHDQVGAAFQRGPIGGGESPSPPPPPPPPPPTLTVFVVIFPIHRLALAATDADAGSERTTSGAFPPLGLKAVGIAMAVSIMPPPKFGEGGGRQS